MIQPESTKDFAIRSGGEERPELQSPAPSASRGERLAANGAAGSRLRRMPRPRVRYYFDEHISIHASMEASLLKPYIVRLTHELIRAYALNLPMGMCACYQIWQPLTAQEAASFHTDSYLQFLQQLDFNGIDVVDDAPNFVLNPSVCFSESAWEYSTIYAGASVAAAKDLASGKSDIAINWMGGQTHARRDCASGFSYLNDVVLAILTLLATYERVLFVNMDAWHPSGVEEAFFTTDRVLCFSIHQHGEGLFPGSGGQADVGKDAGQFHTINLPVAEGFDDADAEELLLPMLRAAAHRFQPHAIVCCAGAGVIAGDRLGGLNMTLDGHAAVLKVLMALERPLLVLGAGGYSQFNAARTYCNATAVLCGIKLPDSIPPHAFREDYLPDYKLAVPQTVMLNKNTPGSLHATKAAVTRIISQMPSRTAVGTTPVATSHPGPLEGVSPLDSGVHAVKTEPVLTTALKPDMYGAAVGAETVKAEVICKPRTLDSAPNSDMMDVDNEVGHLTSGAVAGVTEPDRVGSAGEI